MDDSHRRLSSALAALRAALTTLAPPASAAQQRALLRLGDALDRVLLVLPVYTEEATARPTEAAPPPPTVGNADEAIGEDALSEAHAELARALDEARAAPANASTAPGDDAPFAAWLAALVAAGADLAAFASRSRRANRSGDVGPKVPAFRTAAPTARPLRDVGAAPPPATAGATPPTDALHFGAGAPRAAAVGTAFVASFVAYPASDAATARDTLTHDGLENLTLDAGGAANLRRGTRLVVGLAAKGLKVEDGDRAEQAFVWDGGVAKLQFEVAVPADAAPGTTVLKFDVTLDGLVLASVRLLLAVQAGAAPLLATAPAERQQSLGAALVRTAFASYASKDRARVLDRVAAIRIAAGVDVFLDCRDLNPGKPWQPRLEQEIDRRETFMLFWSRAAADSRWVTWEWERALQKTDGLEHMQIHPLENGVKPPRRLKEVHLGDSMMSERDATLARTP